jgi:hypothetical protein
MPFPVHQILLKLTTLRLTKYITNSTYYATAAAIVPSAGNPESAKQRNSNQFLKIYLL